MKLQFIINAFLSCQVAAWFFIWCISTTPYIQSESQTNSYTSMEEQHSYLGMWVTKDGYIRQELLPNGRYDEARGNRKSAYQGRYWIQGDHIAYADDTGFTADGEFRNSTLYHGGYVFYKETK